jgi:hypothetical protein
VDPDPCRKSVGISHSLTTRPEPLHTVFVGFVVPAQLPQSQEEPALELVDEDCVAGGQGQARLSRDCIASALSWLYFALPVDLQEIALRELKTRLPEQALVQVSKMPHFVECMLVVLALFLWCLEA